MEKFTTKNVYPEIAPEPKISINELTKFVKASDAKKLSIVKGQKYPPIVPTSYYRPVVLALSKFIKSDFDTDIVLDAIEKLQGKVVDPKKKQATTKKANQIAALRQFLKMEFPETFQSIKCSFSSPKVKACKLSDVNVVVAPEIIIRREVAGVKYIGAIKFDIHKDELDFSIGRQRASLIEYFLNNFKNDDERVDKKYCLCVDVMHGNIYRPTHNIMEDMLILEEACGEVYKLWKIA